MVARIDSHTFACVIGSRFAAASSLQKDSAEVGALEEHLETWATAFLAKLGCGRAQVDPDLTAVLFSSTDREGIKVQKDGFGRYDGVLGKLTIILMEKAPRE